MGTVRWLVVALSVVLGSAECVCQEQAGNEKIDAPLPRISNNFAGRAVVPNPTVLKIGQRPIRPGRAPKKAFFLLSGVVYAAAAYDMNATEAEKQWWNQNVRKGLQTCPNCLAEGYFKWFSDSDPLARPLVNLPAPAYYATGIAIATGVNWLGWRMSRSRRFHKVWFVPQLISIGGNARGVSTYY